MDFHPTLRGGELGLFEVIRYEAKDSLEILISDLKCGIGCKKAIIFCRSIEKCAEIYLSFDMALHGLFAEKPYATYHSKTPDRIKKKNPRAFCG